MAESKPMTDEQLQRLRIKNRMRRLFKAESNKLFREIDRLRACLRDVAVAANSRSYLDPRDAKSQAVLDQIIALAESGKPLPANKETTDG